MPPGRSSRDARAQRRAPDRSGARARRTARPRRSSPARTRRLRARPVAGRARAIAPNSTADGLRSMPIASQPASRAASTTKPVLQPTSRYARPSACREMPRHQRHPLAPEPLHAVVVALDAEVADDVLVFLRRVDLEVVRLVEGRAHVDQVARRGSARAACGPCRARAAASRAAAGRAGARRQQVVGESARARAPARRSGASASRSAACRTRPAAAARRPPADTRTMRR